MSKTWYPVIDFNKCIKCGRCVRKCNNGVYDKSKMPEPCVAYPMGCIQGCHGCGNICPVGAITYRNDRTDHLTL